MKTTLLLTIVAGCLASCITIPPGTGISFGTTNPPGIGTVARRADNLGTDITYRTTSPVNAGRIEVRAVENGFEATIWDEPGTTGKEIVE